MVEQRTHHQIIDEIYAHRGRDRTGWNGVLQGYRNYALATVRYRVLEVEGKVEPFEGRVKG